MEEQYEEESNISRPVNDYPEEETVLQGSNETVSREATIDKVFNPEGFLYSIEKTMRGYQQIDNEWVYKNKPLASSSFISKMINSLRSIINTGSAISSKDSEEINFILLEKAKEFTFLVYDEPSIDEEDTESILNIHDHALQMFMGLVEGGKGNSTLRQIAAAVFEKQQADRVSQNGFGIGWGGDNLIKVGGKL